jgi:hypothetical protein
VGSPPPTTPASHAHTSAAGAGAHTPASVTDSSSPRRWLSPPAAEPAKKRSDKGAGAAAPPPAPAPGAGQDAATAASQAGATTQESPGDVTTAASSGTFVRLCFCVCLRVCACVCMCAVCGVCVCGRKPRPIGVCECAIACLEASAVHAACTV